MSRVRPIVFQQPGQTPGQIVIRGANRASEILGRGVEDLERRAVEMGRNTKGAEWFNRNREEYTKSSLDAGKGAIDDMLTPTETLTESLLEEARQEEDPVLRASKIRITQEMASRTTSNILRMQVSRQAGRAVRVGEELGRSEINAISEGVSTAGESIDTFTKYTSLQTENVYGEDVDKINQSMAVQMIEEQVSVLLKQDPKEAIKFINGEISKKWLTPEQRGRMEATVKGISAATLNSIGGQAQDFFEAGDIDSLETQLERVLKFPDSQVKEEVEVQVRTLISRFRNQNTSAQRRAQANWVIIESGSDTPLAVSPETNNQMWRTAQDERREIVYFNEFSRRGLPFAPNAIKQIDDYFSIQNPQFDLGLEVLRTIDRHDPNRVRLLLQSKAITNSNMVRTMFDVTSPGRASVSQANAIETMTRAGAPAALTVDKTAEAIGITRFPGTLDQFGVKRDNQAAIRSAFGLEPDSDLPDEVLDAHDSFYRFTYADVSTRPASPITDDRVLDEFSGNAAMNAIGLDWAPVPRPGRGPVMVKASAYGIGSNVQPDLQRAETLGTFFEAVEQETGGFVAPGKFMRIGNETLAPVISRDISLVTARESVLAFAAVDPHTGKRRVIKKGTKEFDRALRVIETGRPLNPVAQIKRNPGEPRSIAQADATMPLSNGKLRGVIIKDATVDQWMRQNPKLPNPNSAEEMEIFADMANEMARDIGFSDGFGMIDDDQIDFIAPQRQVPLP